MPVYRSFLFAPGNHPRRVEKALSSAQFVVEHVTSAKDCSQFARFARYDAVLIDSDALVFAETLVLVKHLRHENPDASLFVFARYLDLLEQIIRATRPP